MSTRLASPHAPRASARGMHASQRRTRDRRRECGLQPLRMRNARRRDRRRDAGRAPASEHASDRSRGPDASVGQTAHVTRRAAAPVIRRGNALSWCLTRVHARARVASDSEVLMRVGFIGLGAMGGGMARHLVKAGHDVRVWNRTAGSRASRSSPPARRRRRRLPPPARMPPSSSPWSRTMRR